MASWREWVFKRRVAPKCCPIRVSTAVSRPVPWSSHIKAPLPARLAKAFFLGGWQVVRPPSREVVIQLIPVPKGVKGLLFAFFQAPAIEAFWWFP